MSSIRRINSLKINPAKPLWIMIGLILLALPLTTFAQNMDCTLIVPSAPLSALGLATPYQLTATDPAQGPCNMGNKNQTAFVQGVIIDRDSGQISVYNPLIIDANTAPAVMPTVPVLPSRSVVALWFGFNANNLTLVSVGDELDDAFCHQGFGQFASCNAVNFFEEAHDQIDAGKLKIPALGVSPVDGITCPTVRSFFHVDQDQSDNVTTLYLFTATGQVAQNTAANRITLGIPKPRGNPSDNRLLDVFIGTALKCPPWTVPDLADAGNLVPALPLNELQAGRFQKAPIALVPLGDPFTFSPAIVGTPNLDRVNAYRRAVDQPQAANAAAASTKTYCKNLRALHPQKLFNPADKAAMLLVPSVDPAAANTLWTFMAQRYVASYGILGCEGLLGKPVNVILVPPAPATTTDAIFVP